MFAATSSGRNLRQVTMSNGGVASFDLSPDGEWVVFVDYYERLWRISTEQGSSAMPIPASIPGAPKFTPDGEYVLWADAGGIMIYDFVNGGIPSRAAGVFSRRRPDGSRNADKIVYTSSTDGEVYIVTGTSSPNRLSQDSTAGTHPSISADGGRIAYDDSSGVQVIGADGNSLQTFTGYLDLYSGICESGDYVVFTHGVHVFVGDLSSGQLTQITPGTETAYRSFGPSISRNGSRVAFLSAADLTGENGDHSWEIFVTR